jgi:polypeptide N-acetylgalactosaminyltransferase
LDPLQDYVDKLEKVQLIRLKKREGLIRARLKGASAATGEVLIFLDSHCEATEGWLEPLIDPIARNANVSTVPLIEIIDDNTFQLQSTPIEAVQVGGFDWNLIFDWHPVPKYEMERRKHKTDPIRSPTMAGNKKKYYVLSRFFIYFEQFNLIERRSFCDK